MPTYGGTPITVEEAVAWALDPRNDDGTPEAIHVMAFNYDQDCPNVDDHTFVRHHKEIGEPGWDTCWDEEICECWDGITSDDVETQTNPDGSIDWDGFRAWGPFELVFDIDPGLPA